MVSCIIALGTFVHSVQIGSTGILDQIISRGEY